MKKLFVVLFLHYAFLLSTTVSGIAAEPLKCFEIEPIETKFSQVLCPGTENERTVEKTATHYVAVPKECPEGTNSGSPTGGPTSGGSASGGGGTIYQSGGGATISGGVSSTTINPLTCFKPRCILAYLMGECVECVTSSVVLTNGTYNFTETDLELPARAIPIKWSRHYRSNRILPANGGSFAEPMDGPLGFGWMTPYFTRIEKGDTYVDERGLYTIFKKDSAGNFLSDQGNGLILKKTETGYELVVLGGLISQFDQDGKLKSIGDAIGNKVALQYDEQKLTSVIDATGRTSLTFTYNAGDRIETMTDAAGRMITYQYDGFGNLTEVDGLGDSAHTYTYNTYHGLMSKKNALDEMSTIQYEYADRGIVKKVIDPIGNDLIAQGKPPAGHVKTFSYDFQNGVFLVTDYDGSVTKTTANTDGRLTSKEQVLQGGNAVLKNVQHNQDRSEVITDAAGNQTTVQRDEWFNIIRSTDGEGNTTQYSWNFQKRPTQITDPLGVVTKLEYDATGTLLLKKTEAVGTPVERVTDYTYNEYGELKSVTVGGATTAIAYDANGLPETITDPLGNDSHLEYDAAGNLKAVVDAEGNRTTMTHDDLGNVLSVTNPLQQTTHYDYNPEGRLKKITDALQRVTQVETDFDGNITATIDALNNRQEFVFDGSGNLLSITQGDAVTTFAYDTSSRLTGVTDAEGNTTTYAYAEAACSSCGSNSSIPESVIDPFGNATKNLFDNAGRVVGIEDPLSNLTSLAYDAKGQVTSQIDANGNTTSFAYDQLGRLIKQTDAENGETTFTYDQRDNLLTLTDPEQNTTNFEYDKVNRKTKEMRPEGQETVYSYYDNGLLKTVKDPNQQTTTYTYDAANRLTAITYADGTQDTFGYDAVGNMISYANPDMSGSIAYDKLNRKLSETIDYGTFQKSFSYTYDARGNKASYTSPEALEHTYIYRKNDQLESIAVDGKTFSFAYDKNRLKQLTFPNRVKTDYTYNQKSRLEIINTTGSAGTILSRTYNHDKVGNVATKNSDHGAYSYGYDKTYQLTSVDNPTIADEGYTYDKVGNRMTSFETASLWSYNANNELISDTKTYYEYDANGNTTKKTENGVETVYDYNTRNRLSKVYLPDGRQATYAYDPFGRRIKKQVANTTTYFIYADEGLTGEYTEQGATLKTYGWKPDGLWGTDPLYQTDSGQFYFYHNDHLATPQRLTDEQGQIAWSAVYTSFGKVFIDPTLTKTTNNLRFPGQYEDTETGLYYNFQRYYDPIYGRYWKTDPISFAGGDINLYNYAGENPINYIDPNGLDYILVNNYGRRIVWVKDNGLSKVWEMRTGTKKYTDERYFGGPTPRGIYHIEQSPVTVSQTLFDGAFCDGSNNCWWVPYVQQFEVPNKRCLSKQDGGSGRCGMHPDGPSDGSRPGTLGCTGIVGKDTTDLRDMITDYGPTPENPLRVVVIK